MNNSQSNRAMSVSVRTIIFLADETVVLYLKAYDYVLHMVCEESFMAVDIRQHTLKIEILHCVSKTYVLLMADLCNL